MMDKTYVISSETLGTVLFREPSEGNRLGIQDMMFHDYVSTLLEEET